MNKQSILSCLLAVLLPSLALAIPKNEKGSRNIDANGDRVITQAEAKSAGATRLIENFDAIDADGNGELTREEIRTHRQSRMQERRGRAQEADTDGNGALSSDEAAAAGMRRLVDNFDAIDANGDGEVTRDEMRDLRQAKGSKGSKGSKGGKGGQGGQGQGPRQGQGPQS